MSKKKKTRKERRKAEAEQKVEAAEQVLRSWHKRYCDLAKTRSLIPPKFEDFREMFLNGIVDCPELDATKKIETVMKNILTSNIVAQAELEKNMNLFPEERNAQGQDNSVPAN